jgi:uncharacterized membrane protein
MWILGAFIGLSIGAIASPKLWFVGALIGGALGAWIGSLRKSAATQESALVTRLAKVEGDLARLRWEVEELQERQRGQAVPQAMPATTAPVVAETLAMPASPQPERIEMATEPPPRDVPPVARPVASLPRDEPAAPIAIPAEPIELPPWLARFWAGNPLVKIGIILLFFGVASGLRLAAEYGMFPVPVRLFLAAAAAIGLIGFGFAKVRDATHRVFGLSLQGGGFALLYLVAYFMLARYTMIGQGLAFVLFALLGVTCVVMAAKQDGPALAVLGISGAFLAPVLAGGGSDTPLPLFSYFALLNVFILGVDWFRAWRVLNIAGFIFTLAIGMAWGIDRYEDRHYLVTQTFLALFLVAYSAMPVLTALFRAPGLKGWREGMLIFGTPVVGSFLQARLMEGVPYGNAWSALIAALWYAALWWSLYRQNDGENQIVERSHLGLALAFFTLAIPLAFGAQVTSALWAIEGAAVLWYGVQTQRLLPQMTGLVMQVAAGAALLLGWNELGHRLPVANDVVMGGILLTLGGLASARMLRSLGADPEFPPAAPFAWALLWWLGIGLGEIHHFAPEHLHASLGLVYLMATVLLLEGLAAWWSWPRVRAAAVLLLVAMWLAAAHSVAHTGHPLADLLVLVMPVALGLHYGLLLRHERLGAADFADARHLGAYWLALAVVAGELVWRVHQQWAPANTLWPFVALALTMAAGIALPAWGARKDIWPFAPPAGRYVTTGALLPALAMVGILPWAAVSLSGDGSGLPYLPLLNVFDLTQLAGLAALRTYADAARADHRAPLRVAIAGIAFVWLSTLAARIVHAWAGVPFEFAVMMRSTLFQMLLTLFWTVTSITTMILASRQARRELWFGGFALLGIVGGKLLLFDAAGRGTLMWTGTLIGVAVLVLAASYFAPLPPRDSTSGAPDPA